ncbi:MAG: hypothetical protein JW882_17540 [Deltaproteobacteria bacterium]|nr:hypothetical protein [Deltaproteobacteria bacterium]
MVELNFQFEVAREKQEKFLKYVKEIARPWWLSHGCQAYSMWKVEGEDVFIKRMEFSDMATLERVIPANEQDPECKELIKNFDYFTANNSRKILTQAL